MQLDVYNVYIADLINRKCGMGDLVPAKLKKKHIQYLDNKM